MNFLANHLKVPRQLPSASDPAASSRASLPAQERPATHGPLQRRAGGAAAGIGIAQRQSLQVLRREGQGADSVPAGAVSPGHHVIDIDRPGLRLAEARALDRRNCDSVLLMTGLMAAGASGLTFLQSYALPDRQQRHGLYTPTFASAALSAAAFGAWVTRRRHASRPANPADVPEAGMWWISRAPTLYARPLATEVARFRAQLGAPGPAAEQFDWNAPKLFVDSAEVDQTQAVSHMLNRALREYQGSDTLFKTSLGVFLDQLATHPELRTDVADLVVDANSQCQDRIGIRLGELLLTQALREVRDPAAAPPDVVLTLVLHAATQAMKKGLATLLANHVPSADLLLAGFHAMQTTLQKLGIAVPTMFPAEDHKDEPDLADLRSTLPQLALDIARCCGLQPAEVAGSSEAGAALREARGTGLAMLLRLHGGKAYDDILAARLAHLREPVLAAWHDKDAAGQGVDGYEPALDRAYGKAIAGALEGDVADWAPPAETPRQAGANGPATS